MPIFIPIVIAVALHTSTVADTVPRLDVVRECQAEVGDEPGRKNCIDEENRTRQELKKEWSTFNAADRRVCGQEAAMGGASSYAEFLTCLEMARDTRTNQTGGSQGDQVTRNGR